MPRSTMSTADLLAASQRCCDVIVDAGGASGVTAAVLAAAAGMSERTFFRYFPTKEDCARPVFDDGARRYAAALAAQPAPGDPAAAITRAVAETFAGEDDTRTRALMAAVFDDPTLRRIWLQASYATGQLLRPSVAALIDSPGGDIRTSVLAGQAALVVVIAIEHLVRDGTPLEAGVRAAADEMFGATL